MTPDLTPTQQTALDRHRAFRQSIARKAAELAAARAVTKTARPPVKAVKPEALPAEPDPPRTFRPPMIWPVIPDLEQYHPPLSYRVADVQDAVCKYYGVSKLDLQSRRRLDVVVYPRHVAMYLAKHLSNRSFPDIGRRFGGRDHTTVLHAVRKVERLLLKDENLAFEVAQLIEAITGQQDVPVTTSKQRSSSGDEEMKVTLFANVYRPFAGSCGHIYESKELADQMAAQERLACVEFFAEVPAPGETNADSSIDDETRG